VPVIPPPGAAWISSAELQPRLSAICGDKISLTVVLVVLIGAVMVVMGLVVGLNLLQAADALASFAKPMPSWVRLSGSENPVAYRVAGFWATLLGCALIVVGLINR
jgi:hypothetical protein